MSLKKNAPQQKGQHAKYCKIMSHAEAQVSHLQIRGVEDEHGVQQDHRTRDHPERGRIHEAMQTSAFVKAFSVRSLEDFAGGRLSWKCQTG